MGQTALPLTILAGGKSSRMQVADKCLLPLDGKAVVEHIIDTFGGRVGPMMINTNSDPRAFSRFNLPLCADVISGRLGPLAGIATAMMWARELGAQHVVTVPADMPFLPRDLISCLTPLTRHRRVAVVSDGLRVHPTIGLWPVVFAERLLADLQAGMRSVQQWCVTVGVIEMLYLTDDREAFTNLNTIADLAEASCRLGAAH